MMGSSRAVAAIAVLAAAGLTGGAGYALVQATDEPSSAPAALPTPTLSPAPLLTLTPTPEATPSATPTPSPSASATATPSPSVSPSASATASPRTSTSRTYAYPKPTSEYAGLFLSATIDPGSGTTETTFSVTAKASDADGIIYFAGLDWGDGTKVPAEANPQKCGSYPSPTSQPGPYRPQPDAYERTKANAFTHRYAKAGTYTVTVRVSSVNADCRPHGPKAEARTVLFDRVIVTAPAP